ncbi:hypothetical protein J132_01631 [Termitomyces sp. J132]|nr:hypothetical protein J132_01631 [Termitomyces sp. J132]
MSVYNPAYNPASYLTDVYGQPVPENPYALHSTLPPSAREYLQAGAALPHSPLMATIPVCTLEDTLQHPLTLPTFLLPTITRTQSPLQPQPLWGLWIIIPPSMLFPAQAPPSPRQQRVEAYAQQHDEVLCFLHLSPVEFARRTHTLLTNLGYHDTSATLEVWPD